MDQHDKVYLWMVVASLLALLVAIGFSVAETNDLKTYQASSSGF
jgi:hypothetical protein